MLKDIKILNAKVFEKQLNQLVIDNYVDVGEMLVDKISLLLEAEIGRPTKLTKGLSYKIEGDSIIINSDSPVVKFLDQGTDPHVIRPKKPGGSLSFRATESVTRKDGSKINFGETVFAKEVKHPGILPREFVSKAMFLIQKDLKEKIFKQDNARPPTK